MLKIGLTGGTGSGKSTAARRLSARGAVVVDADLLAREVMAPGTPGLAAVVEEFGPEVLAADGGLDRVALAAAAFSSDERRRALEAITHPLIAARTAELVAAAPPRSVLVHDVPLLVEKGMGPGYHLVVVVDAPVEVRVRRLVGRGMPEQDARRRIAVQADDAARRAAADVWLENTGTSEQLDAAVDRLWDERLVPFLDALEGDRTATAPDEPVPADPTWPAQADRLVARVHSALGELAGLLVGPGVVHAGPTSRGERAPDVIGLEAVVRSVADVAAVVERTPTAGFATVADAVSDGSDAVRLGSCDPARAAVLVVRT